YGEVMKLRPSFVSALANRAAIYRGLGQPGLALADLNQAIKVNPEFANALRDRANLYKENNRPDLAIADYSRARDAYDRGVALYPDDLELLTARAECAYEAKRWRDVIADYSKVIERDPKMVQAYVRRANAYASTLNPAPGLADAETALKLDWRNQDGKFYRAYFNRVLGNFQQALEDYGDMAGSGNVRAFYNRGVVYFALGQYDRAESDFRAYLAANKGDPHAHNWLHIVRFKRSLADDPDFAALPSSPVDRFWAYEISNLFRGKTPFEEVEARAKAVASDPSEQGNWPCVSKFFLGEYKLEHRDIAGAKRYLGEITPSNCADGAAAAAVAELKRLPEN
ncbi:MAG: tetratricopeptide repeat protein, partial [Rhizomicrobium sp.]